MNWIETCGPTTSDQKIAIGGLLYCEVLICMCHKIANFRDSCFGHNHLQRFTKDHKTVRNNQTFSILLSPKHTL
jgi:hypothetical protein